MIYFVPDPFCDEGITIQHVMDGVFAMSAKNTTCESCIRFMIRVSPHLNIMEDEEATKFIIEVLGAEILND